MFNFSFEYTLYKRERTQEENVVKSFTTRSTQITVMIHDLWLCDD